MFDLSVVDTHVTCLIHSFLSRASLAFISHLKALLLIPQSQISQPGSTPSIPTWLHHRAITPVRAVNPSFDYVVDPDGDIILFTPGAFLPNTTAGRVEECLTRFRVSSKHLKLASPYFKAMLQNCWAEGRDLLTNGSAEIPVHICSPDITHWSIDILISWLANHSGRYGPTSHRGWFTQPWSCIVSYSAGSR